MPDDELKELMEEVREEHRLNREFQARQMDVMTTVIDRNAQAFQGLTVALNRFGESMEGFGEKLDDLGDKIDLFGDKIDLFGDKIDLFGDKIDLFGDKIDAFGATLELQREILLRFLDRLDDELPPPQG